MTQNIQPQGILEQIVDAGHARVIITYQGRTGDLADPMLADSSHDDVRRMAQEALRTGGVRGIPAMPDADLSNFIVDRAEPNDVHPHMRLLVRPKTDFGMPDMGGGECTGCWKLIDPRCPVHGRGGR